MPTNKNKSSKVLTGTFRPCREKAGSGEPLVETKTIPSPPDVVTGNDIALEEWNRVSPLLWEAGLLSKLDVTALAMYCLSFALHVRAETELKDQPLIITSASGNDIKNPLLSISSMALANMLKVGRQFGMTPASRSKVTVKKIKKGKDPWAEFGTKK